MRVQQTVNLWGTWLAFEHFKPDQAQSVLETSSRKPKSCTPGWCCWLEHSLGKSFSGGWQNEPLTQHPAGIGVSRAQSAFLSTFVNIVLSPERPGSLASRVWNVGERTSLILQAAWSPEKSWKHVTSETFLHVWQGHSARAWISSDVVSQTTGSIWWLLRASQLRTVGEV